MLTPTVRKSAIAVAALGAVSLGGAAIAGAADTNKSPSSAKSHAHRVQRETLSADAAAKVKAAALAKVPGASVLRTEAGGPYGTPYHAHVKTSDGTLKVVLVDSSFQATAVQADQGRGPRGGPGKHGGPGETRLTAGAKDQVEAAVLARYPGATIIRTETNGDSTSPYESHIATSDGRRLEVHVSKDYDVVDAREQPAMP